MPVKHTAAWPCASTSRRSCPGSATQFHGVQGLRALANDVIRMEVTRRMSGICEGRPSARLRLEFAKMISVDLALFSLKLLFCAGQWRREGIKGGTVQGAAFGGSKIWNSEIWPLLANWRWHCRTDSTGSLV